MINGKPAGGEMLIQAENFGVQANGLLYCCTTVFSDVMCGLMQEKFGYDAAFEIMFPMHFGKHLSKHLVGREYMHGEVTYIQPPIASVSDMPEINFFEKRPDYAWQKEYRFVWSASFLEEKGFKIKIPEIKNLIRRVL